MTALRRWLAEPDDAPAAANETLLLLLVGAAWLLFFSVQALVRPVDGFMLAHVRTPTAAYLSGPLGGAVISRLLAFLPPEFMSWRALYALLLIAVPTGSVWWIQRGCQRGRAPRHTRLALTAVALMLAIFALCDLPYLSNDVYLYRAHGLMLSQHGVSPYMATPAQVLPASELQHVPWVHQECPYGPLALIGFGISTAVWPHGMAADFLRLKVLLGLPLLLLPLMLLTLRRFDLRERFMGLAWLTLNPLLILEIGQNAHLEGWVGLLLVWTVLVLDRPATAARVAAAGALCGLACALKLSLLLVVPIAFAWIWAEQRPRFSRQAVGRLVLFGLAFAATLAVLYVPFWQGAITFIGLRQESAKVIRSFYAMLGYAYGLTPHWIFLGERIANLAAVAIGVWLAVRRRSLTGGLICALLIQALLGRTFVQPWHFCPVLILVPFLGVASAPGNRRAGWMEQPHFRMVLLALSVSLLGGGYAVLLGAESRADIWQTLSFMGMVVPPLLLLAWTRLVSRQPGATPAKNLLDPQPPHCL